MSSSSRLPASALAASTASWPRSTREVGNRQKRFPDVLRAIVQRVGQDGFRYPQHLQDGWRGPARELLAQRRGLTTHPALTKPLDGLVAGASLHRDHNRPVADGVGQRGDARDRLRTERRKISVPDTRALTGAHRHLARDA